MAPIPWLKDGRLANNTRSVAAKRWGKGSILPDGITTARTTATVSTAVWPISRSTFAPAAAGYARNRIAIEVRLVVGEIPSAFDGQRRRSSNFAVARLAALRSRLAATHLRPLLFKDGLARKPNAITLNRKHLHQHLVAFFEFVAHILDAMLSHFADA